MNRLLLAALGAATLTVGAADAAAYVGNARSHAGLQLASGAAVRSAPALTSVVPARAREAWQRFIDQRGAWTASWDAATGVPSRLLGPGIYLPGSVSSATLAEAYARVVLRDHLELLAPGASADDFQVVSNHFDGDMRTVGFYQFHQGMRVIGGQVSFRFKNDRLFVIGSEALPHVTVRRARLAVPSATARRAATQWIAKDAAGAEAGAVEGPFILPLIDEAGLRGYRTVMRTGVRAREPIGRWQVYVDAASGAAVAREQTLRFATGEVRYKVPVRHPGGAYDDYLARNAEVTVDGVKQVTSSDGLLTWPTEAPVSVVTGVTGPLVEVLDATKTIASATFELAPGGTLIWDARADDPTEAQLNTYIHSVIAKEYVRTFAPGLAFLDAKLRANVNIDDECNAFSDGETINFFRSGERCQNTGRMADVVYHEFGHSMHAQSIIEGSGTFDGAFSEGLADYLAASITEDPGMGRGFFYDDEPLRHIDPIDGPTGGEHVWPNDIGEIHYTGLIFAGAMWDLRKLLIEKLGYDEAVVLANRLFYAAVQRAANIPATYAEILAADDDDGDLSNGTPNICLINQAFGIHGLRDLQAELTPLSVESVSADGLAFAASVSGLTTVCPDDTITAARVRWRVRGDDDSQIIDLAETSPGSATFEGTLPAEVDGSVIEYQVELQHREGWTRVYPANQADQYYEYYVGELVELYCTDFETDPFASGWTQGHTGDGVGDWEWGPPTAAGGDPAAAVSGMSVFGNDLSGDGFYNPDESSWVESPAIDVGNYSDVHVQYYRWLEVEDGFFDQASIYANDEVAWQNFDSNQGDSSSVHHLDGEWQFHDVPVSEHVATGSLRVKLELTSDPGLEFGGWTIDDFCVVANPRSICGDGELSGAEQCDDGDGNDNSAVDSCRTNCRLAACGDGVLDTGESCDDGNRMDDQTCPANCLDPNLDTPSGGCCDANGGSGGSAAALALAVLLFLARRRRSAE